MKIKGTHTYIGADNKQEPVRKDIELDVLGFNNLNLTGKNIDEFYVALYFNNAEDVVTTGEVGELADYKFNNVSAFYNGYANGPDHIREIEIRLEDTDNYYNRNIITAKVSTMNGATEEFVNQLWNELDSIVEAETGSSIDDNLGAEKEKADQRRAQAEEDELKIDGDYAPDVIEKAQEIFDNSNLVGADIYIDKDGVSVLVKDTVSNTGFWFDIFPSKEGDLEGDWNQYIFHNNFGDQVRSALQNNGRFFEAVFEVAENYAMEKEAIKWNDETNKYEFKTESKKVNKKENKKGIGRYLKEDFYDGDGDYDEADWEEEAMGEEREDVEEYIISFEPGELYDQYGGEFITENDWEADDLFEDLKEEHKLDQVDKYMRKVWKWDRVNEEYYETDVEIYFNAGDELEYYDEAKKVTEAKPEEADKEIWEKVEHIVDAADNEIAPDQSAEYDYDEHIKFVICRDFEYEDIFAVYTYVDGKVQEDLDTGDVHLEDLDATIVDIVKKLQGKKIESKEDMEAFDMPRYTVYEYENAYMDELLEGGEPSPFTIYDNELDDFYYDELRQNPVFDTEEEAEQYIRDNKLNEALTDTNRVIVYQIDNIENCDYAFMDYDFAKSKGGPDLKDYKKVAEVDITDIVNEDTDYILEDVFAFGNTKDEYYKNNPEARSISVSDILEFNGDKYYVNSAGFTKLDKDVKTEAVRYVIYKNDECTSPYGNPDDAYTQYDDYNEAVADAKEIDADYIERLDYDSEEDAEKQEVANSFRVVWRNNKKKTEAEDMTAVKDNIEKTKEDTESTEQEIEQVKGSLEVLKTDEEEAIAGYDTFVDNSAKVVDDKLADAIDDEMQEIIQDEKDHIEKLDTIKTSLGESRYVVYDYADGNTMEDEEEKGLEPSQFTIYDNEVDNFYYDELGNNPVFDTEKDAEEYIKKNLTENYETADAKIDYFMTSTSDGSLQVKLQNFKKYYTVYDVGHNTYKISKFFYNQYNNAEEYDKIVKEVERINNKNKKTEATVTKLQTLTVDKDGNEMLLKDVSYNNACSWLEKELAKAGSKVVDTETKGNKTIIKADNKTKFEYDEDKGTLKRLEEAIDPEQVKEKVEKAKADIGLKQAEEIVDTENELTDGIKKEIIQYAKQQGLDVEKLQKQGELNSVAEALDNIIGEMVSKSANEFMDTTGKNIEWDFEVKDNNINVIWNEVK